MKNSYVGNPLAALSSLLSGHTYEPYPKFTVLPFSYEAEVMTRALYKL